MLTKMALVVALTATSISNAFANNLTFGETKTLLSGEDVKQFEVKDLNGDYRLDLIWLTNSGDIKYKLRDNMAFENFEDLQGTKWRLTFDNAGTNEWLTFEGGGGIVEDKGGNIMNIVKYDVLNNGEHIFCRDYPRYGLGGTNCVFKYSIKSFDNNTLNGVYLYNNEPWTASQILN